MAPATELSHETLVPSLKDKTTFLAFYADWCPHCKRYLASGALDQVAQRVDEAGDSEAIGVYKFEGSTIPEHIHLAKTLFKDADGQAVPIERFPTFVMTRHREGAPLQYEFLDPQTPREADAQYAALMEFHRRASA